MERSNYTEMGYNANRDCDCEPIGWGVSVEDYREDRPYDNKGVECPSCGHNIGCFDLYMLEGKIVSDPIVCENCGSRVRLKDNFWECELC